MNPCIHYATSPSSTVTSVIMIRVITLLFSILFSSKEEDQRSSKGKI